MIIKIRPDWLKKKIDFEKLNNVQKILNEFSINTVCVSARCPNISECFSKNTATFMILGNICTRGCEFCNVAKGTPGKADKSESKKVLQAVKQLKLKYVVITSVTRDDLDDGGAFLFADCIQKIKNYDNNIKVEVLVPDFKGNKESILTVLKEKPDVFGHNIETVPELYYIRKGADYKRSIEVLEFAKKNGAKIKTAILLGLGENKEQVVKVLKDLRNINCDFLSIGQYLQPDKKLLPVREYIKPEDFEYYKKIAYEMGFVHVESGSYVRSSYMADKYLS